MPGNDYFFEPVFALRPARRGLRFALDVRFGHSDLSLAGSDLASDRGIGE